MLVWLLVLVFNKPLWELVHEVCCHTHNFGLIHCLLNFGIIYVWIFCNVPLQILVLCLHLDVVGWCCWSCSVDLSVLILRVLIAFLDLGLFKEHTPNHRVLVKESLYFLCLHGKQSLKQWGIDAAWSSSNKHRLESVEGIDEWKWLHFLLRSCTTSSILPTTNTCLLALVQGWTIVLLANHLNSWWSVTTTTRTNICLYVIAIDDCYSLAAWVKRVSHSE